MWKESLPNSPDQKSGDQIKAERSNGVLKKERTQGVGGWVRGFQSSVVVNLGCWLSLWKGSDRSQAKVRLTLISRPTAYGPAWACSD